MTKNKYHSGQNCDKAGKYAEYDSNGKVVNSDIDLQKDSRFPPTSKKGNYFKKKQ